jgi:hypothetical protein
MVLLSSEERLIVARVLYRYTIHRSQGFCDKAVMTALQNWIQEEREFAI